MAWITARFESRCKECGQTVSRGSLMVYPPGLCELCGNLADEPDKPQHMGFVGSRSKGADKKVPDGPKCADCWHLIAAHDSTGCACCPCLRGVR